jgi:glutathione S-transferase
MAPLTLYHISPSRSSVVHWMLEEIGEPFELHVLNMKAGENRQLDYLAINPMGKVPALRHGEAIITEVAAICCYLADAFPQARLNVPIGDPRRGPYLKWLFFAPGVLEPAIIDRRHKRVEEAPRQMLSYGDFDTTMNVVARAVSRSPFLVGDQFTAADIVIGSMLRWTMMFDLIPARPEFTDYVARFADRPALKRATAKDEEIAKSQQQG